MITSKPKSSKKIYILDCDHLYKTSTTPNYKVMKLISYHTQLGNKVTFITEEYQLTGQHDTLYLVRELRHTPFPPGDLLDDKRTILIGKEFEAFDDVQELPIEAAVCRPDYTVYEPNGSIYDHASFVQFFQSGVYLKNAQDWHRAESRSTLIVDDSLWDAPPQTVAEALKRLEGEPNIIFEHPIKLKKLLEKEVFNAFTQLKLAKFAKLRYNNNVGEDVESVKMLIDIMSGLKEKYSYLRISALPVKIITKDHWADKQNILYDFTRCLQIMAYAQQKMVRISFKYPKLRLSSPSWYYFEFFKTWSNHYHTLPYIQALLSKSEVFYKKPYYDILNNERLWTTAKIKQAVHLIGLYPDLMRQYGFTLYGGGVSKIIDKVDFNYVKEKGIENSIF